MTTHSFSYPVRFTEVTDLNLLLYFFLNSLLYPCWNVLSLCVVPYPSVVVVFSKSLYDCVELIGVFFIFIFYTR